MCWLCWMFFNDILGMMAVPKKKPITPYEERSL